MKKELKNEPKRHLEINSYEHKGIKVKVKINYDNGHIALIEDKWNDKRWIFSKRGLAYMQGWQDILDAMKYAISEATKLLEEDRSRKEMITEEEIIQAIEYTKKKW